MPRINTPINPLPAVILFLAMQGVGLTDRFDPGFAQDHWIAAGILALATCIAMLMLHYACWDSLNPEERRTTPDKAIGFLFIPFFNLYWVFVSYVGLAQDLELATGEKSVARPLGIALAIMFVLDMFVRNTVPAAFTPFAAVETGVILAYMFVVTRQANRLRLRHEPR